MQHQPHQFPQNFALVHRAALDALAHQYGKDAKTLKLYLKLSSFPTKVLETISAHPHIFSTREVFKYFVEPRNYGEDDLMERLGAYIAEKTESVAGESSASLPGATESDPPSNDKTIGSTKTLMLQRKARVKDDEFQRSTAVSMRELLPPIKLKVSGERGKGKVEFAWQSEAEFMALMEALSTR